CSLRLSLTRPSRPSAFWRAPSSLLLSLPWVISQGHASNEFCCNRKLGGAEPHRFLRRHQIDTVDLEQNAAGFDLGDPEFGRTLARAHAHLSGLFRNRHVG